MADQLYLPWIIAVGCGLLIGCQGDAESARVPLHGFVRVQGAPVTAGSLSLLPVAGHSGPAASTSISGGQYAFTTATGPVAGPHRAVVGVLASDEDETAAASARAAVTEDRSPSDAAIQSPPQRDPKRRSAQQPKAAASRSQWEAAFDVPSDGEHRVDLDLGTK